MRLSGKNMSQTGQPFSHLRTKFLSYTSKVKYTVIVCAFKYGDSQY